VGICSRSKDIIEPVIRPQWYVDVQSMAKKAADAVRNKQLEIIPAFQEPVWYSWLDNPQDWCVSRQLWWGHRIPAYIVRFEGEEGEPIDDGAHWFVGRSADEAKAKAEQATGKRVLEIRRDEDVLDTWFSSGLFPFSVMGWPNQTADLAKFYPGALLETGHDILFFWVARMVMLGLELTGTLPFKTVYLHAMVRDKFGRKMVSIQHNTHGLAPFFFFFCSFATVHAAHLFFLFCSLFLCYSVEEFGQRRRSDRRDGRYFVGPFERRVAQRQLGSERSGQGHRRTEARLP
jgi:valyl-tRNA synthetase